MNIDPNYLPKPKDKNHEALYPDMEQSSIIISLIKDDHLVKDKKILEAEDDKEDLDDRDDLSFKLSKVYLTDIFARVKGFVKRQMAANDGHQGPPGWRVEGRPRANQNYLTKNDWFYYEPGTEKQYRSLKKAWARYEEIKKQDPESAKGPDSVKWVFPDLEYNECIPYVGNEMVHEHQKKLWAQSFELSMRRIACSASGGNSEQEHMAGQTT